MPETIDLGSDRMPRSSIVSSSCCFSWPARAAGVSTRKCLADASLSERGSSCPKPSTSAPIGCRDPLLFHLPVVFRGRPGPLECRPESVWLTQACLKGVLHARNHRPRLRSDAAILYCFIFLLFFVAGPGRWSVDQKVSG